MTDDADRLSILQQLRQRHDEIVQQETLDLPVPRWRDPEVLVRYRPLDHPTIRRAMTAVEKAPKRERFDVEVNTNIDLLVRACEAVIARIDDQDYSLRPNDPKGEFTRFDPDLAENLGLGEGATAREVVKALFFTDGDIVSAADELIRWSGYRRTQADDRLEGE